MAPSNSTLEHMLEKYGKLLLILVIIAVAALCFTGKSILDQLLYESPPPVPVPTTSGLPPPPTVDDRRPAQPTLSPRPPLSPSTHGTGARPGQHAAPGH